MSGKSRAMRNLAEEAINTGVVTSRIKALNQAESLKILVVDDDEIELSLVGDQLEGHGFEVVRASNGQEALALMEGQFFPVLLTDWQMPLMDGIELAERVRARGMDETYIMMLTIRDGRFDYERGYSAGIDDYLTKKLPDVELHARITAAFDTAALRRALKEARAALVAAQSQMKSAATTEDFGGTSQIIAFPVMQPPKVLLVDDDEILLERLKIPVIEAGYEVYTATDSVAALAALQKNFMSIVVLDRSMPGMDGLALCRSIRRQTWPGYVYIVLLTAHDAEEDVLLGLAAGADDYVSKRVSDAQLVARLSAATRVLSLEHSLKCALDERRRIAMTDALTGAHNRRYFMRYLSGELKRSRRFSTELSLLMLDIDHFKQVNDSYGHAAGDAVLRKFVKTIQKCLPREYDWCARIGGEEFVVVLPQTDLAGAAVVAERIRNSIEEIPMRTRAGVRSITVSIGVSGLQAMANRNATTVDILLADADRYLYASKAAGRNRVTLPEQSPVS